MWSLFASAHQFWFLHILVSALTMFWGARDDLPLSAVCFVSRVCIPRAQCWLFLSSNSCRCSLDLSCSGFEVGVGHLLQEPISSVGCVSAVHQISSTGIGMSGREDRDLPDDGEDGRGADRGNGGRSGLAVAEVHPGFGRPGGRVARNVIRDDARLLDDVASELPTAAIGRGTICNSRNPQAGELLPGGRLVLNFHDDPGWDHSRLFLWPIDATTWIVLTPDGDKFAERFADYSRMRVLSLGVGEMPEVGSVEFHCGWTLNVLSELVREGRNLALCARTSTGSTRR